MRIYSIIVTYNGVQWLDKCLGSLIGSTVATKILVIDNKSTDGTPDRIRSRYPSVEIIEVGQNLGFAKANNIGLTRALNENADYVFLLNQDAWVETDTIEKLVSVQSSEYGILSPIHLNGQGDALDFGFAKHLLDSLTPDFISDIYLSRLLPLYEIQYVNAAAWLLNIKCVKKIGGFDPSFFMYGEDWNYMMRVKYYGYKIGICPSAKIYHDRQERENKKPDSMYIDKTWLKICFYDLNESLVRKSARFLISKSTAALKNILRLRPKNVFIHIYSIVFVIVSFREIVSSRKNARRRCAFITSFQEK